jgi:hypothetical protein
MQTEIQYSPAFAAAKVTLDRRGTDSISSRSRPTLGAVGTWTAGVTTSGSTSWALDWLDRSATWESTRA